MDIIKKIFSWRWIVWWLPPVISFVLLALLVFFSMVSLQSFCGRLAENLAGVCFVAIIVHILVLFIIGVILIFKRKILCGAVICIQSVLFGGIAIIYMLSFSFLFMLNDTDHFADNLKLPNDVPLLEPLQLRPLELLAEMPSPKDAINWSVLLDAVENGKELGDDEPCRLPSLEKLMETPEGEQRLLDYLAASPYWTVRDNDVDGVYAHRNMGDEAAGFELSESHSTFFITRKNPHSQYSFKIYLSGLPDRLFAKGVKDLDCIPYKDNGKNGCWNYDTWLTTGKAKVFIHEGAEKPGRRMTRKLLELVDEELESLDMQGLGRNAPQKVTLIDGMQGGMYLMEIWCNPGQSGTLSITANEITKGTHLSEYDLSKEKIRVYGAPDGLVYFSCIGFTIYEGNWEQYYGAHFELWFTPDGSSQKRILWDGNYKIRGWQR